MRRTYTMPIFLLAAALAVRPALAQPAAPASAGAVTQAEALFQEGMRFIAQKQWAEAEQRFLAAWALNPSYDVAANLGQTQYRLGKHRAAAEHLAYAVKNWPLVGKKETRELAEKRLGELRAMLASLSIEVTVAGAQVSVDGAPVGRSPLGVEVFVDPGSHVVEAKLDGYDGARVEVQAAKGSKPQVTVTLTRAAPQAAPTPVPSVPPANETLGPARPPKAVLIAGGVLAASGLAAGIGLTVAANGKSRDVAALGEQVGGPSACLMSSATCAALRDAAGSRDRLSNGALWSFVGGGALTLATAGLAVWIQAAPKASPPVQVVPVVGATRGVEVKATW